MSANAPRAAVVGGKWTEVDRLSECSGNSCGQLGKTQLSAQSNDEKFLDLVTGNRALVFL